MSATTDAGRRLPKPQLRGLCHSYMRKHGMIAAVFCTITTAAFKFGVADRRKQIYADFYRNYDAEAEFQRMRQLGLFTSCKPDKK